MEPFKPTIIFILVFGITLGCMTHERAPLLPDRSLELKAYDLTPSSFFARQGVAGMVVADDEQSAEWGVEILRRGGNAIDAAVATAFGMAVTRPHFASLGGGGFAVFCFAQTKKCHSLDFREKAPLHIKSSTYRIDQVLHSELSEKGALASGTPGIPMGLLTLLKKWGRRSRSEVLEQPLSWAKNGIRMSTNTEISAQNRWNAMNATSRSIWSCGNNNPCPVGTLIRQPDLARVLKAILDHGTTGFYQGWVAKKITEGLQREGGILTLDDFKNYEAIEREPLVSQFQGLKL